MKLIDKDKVAGEIEERLHKYEQEYAECARYEFWGTAREIRPKIEELKNLCSFIDSLETKEVDLEKEIDKWWCSLYTDYSMMRVPNHKFVPEPAYLDSNFKQSEIGKTKIAFELWMDWKVDSNDIEWDADTIRNFAKHFFELGLRAKDVNEIIKTAEDHMKGE